MTPEQIEKQKEHDRQRYANRTPEQIEKEREYKRQYRVNMTPEQIEKENECQRQRYLDKIRKNPSDPVYVALDPLSGEITIGKSKNVQKRIIQHKRSNHRIRLLFTTPDADELILHYRYEKYKIEGTREWFALPPKVLEELINTYQSQ